MSDMTDILRINASKYGHSSKQLLRGTGPLHKDLAATEIGHNCGLIQQAFSKDVYDLDVLRRAAPFHLP